MDGERTVIKLTDEMLEQAKDYIPLLKKVEIASAIAQDSMVKVDMSYIPTGHTEEDRQQMPCRYQEYPMFTRLNLMGVLAIEYFGDGAIYSEEQPYRMPANLYDMWAGGNIVGQLESLRRDKKWGEKASNIIADYRDFRAMVFQEINTIVEHNNDVVWRLFDAFDGFINNVTNTALLGDLQGITDASKANEPVTAEEAKERAMKAMDTLDENIKKMKELRENLGQALEERKRKQSGTVVSLKGE